MIISSISEFYQLNVSRSFFEMHNLFIIWLFAFQFVRCKILYFCIRCYCCSNLLAYFFSFFFLSFFYKNCFPFSLSYYEWGICLSSDFSLRYFWHATQKKGLDFEKKSSFFKIVVGRFCVTCTVTGYHCSYYIYERRLFRFFFRFETCENKCLVIGNYNFSRLHATIFAASNWQ